MSQWNYADIWEEAARRFPDSLAQVHGKRRFTWAEFDRRANALGKSLLESGLGKQAKIAQYLYNGPEYLESLFGIFKAGLVPVNTNYRYGIEELEYLWTNADVEAVIFHASLVQQCEVLRTRLPQIRAWICMPDAGNDCPQWAMNYETVAGQLAGRTISPWGRSGEDLMILYTGGTTGLPKGVMWTQDSLFQMLESVGGRDLPAPPDPSAFVGRRNKPGPIALVAAPLMHGTATWFAMGILSIGGNIVTLPNRHYDPQLLLDVAELEHVASMVIVGDAFAKPLLRDLEHSPNRWNLGDLRIVFSAGLTLSPESKQRLLRLIPQIRILDSLGTSESGAIGRTLTGSGDNQESEGFRIGENIRVLAEDNSDVVPGSGMPGRLAVRGHLPLGYYKDEKKTAETFIALDGNRYAVAGDWAEVKSDGTIRLIGRGSLCVNTGGEKVFPEEVEEVVKRFPDVADAAVVGVPDDNYGEAVTVLLQSEDDAPVDEAALITFVKQSLAGYKAPRHVFRIESLNRAPSGKLDYKALRDIALEQLASSGRTPSGSVGR
jgi:acyl-CoA synthetase (AMP-forming)/AMP-acid ligase II